jgi:transcriptional regulator with XRE-family HTH domain
MARAQTKVKIGVRVRSLRHEAGLTQAQLAEAVSIAPETMSRIERGRLVPSTDLVGRLAGAIGVEPGALFASTPVSPQKATLRAVERRLLQVVRDLPDELVEDVIRGVRLLVDVGREAPEQGKRRRS